MIQLNNASLRRGGKLLFENSSLTIHDGQRFGLVGHNGCGKSSLFQALLGNLSIDSGELHINPKWQVAHMAQEVDATKRMAREYIIDGFAYFRELEAKLEQAGIDGDNDRMAEVLGQLDAIKAYDLKHQAESLMQGLGFASDEYEKAVGDFSGGWRIRLNLARCLIQPSDLLLLDEPTNHLDIDAIRFLEQWLKSYQGTVVLVSHDRDFIDATVSHIAHIENQKIQVYTGSYSQFERQRAEQLVLQQAMFEKQQQRKAHLESFIRRFKAKATKAKQAQSRVKALERMQEVAAVRESSPYQFAIPCHEKLSSPLLNSQGIDVGFNEKVIVSNVNFSLTPESRVALLGQNGAGKSTVMKTIAGAIKPINGEMVAGEHLKIAYFAQHQLEALDLQASAQTHLQRITPKASEQSIRDFLGRFKIHGDMATEAIAPFSGGEKARLALAILAWSKPNLLLLDEPTNHLDIEMREALADALQNFEGAVVLVSHDRYLLRHTVDDFWLVADGRMENFSGDLDDYYQWQEQRQKEQSSSKDNASKVAINKKQQRIDAAEKRKAQSALQKKAKKAEEQVIKYEQALEDLQQQLADNDLYNDENKQQLQQLLEQQANTQKLFNKAEEEWLAAEEALEQV